MKLELPLISLEYALQDMCRNSLAKWTVWSNYYYYQAEERSGKEMVKESWERPETEEKTWEINELRLNPG